MASTPVVQARNLEFGWRAGGPLAIDIPAFAAGQGERVFVHGPSGSGKSTLLGLLGAVLVPDAGTLQVLGSSLEHLGAAKRDRFRAAHVGFIFQQFNLVPYLSVIDNVLLALRFSRRRRERARAGGNPAAQEARRLLERLDIAPALLDRDVTQLSVGQQQRVAAARALIGRPELILADEPTSSLDAERQRDFLQLLGQECAAAEATLIFVSHDLRLAAGFDTVVDLASLNRAQAGKS